MSARFAGKTDYRTQVWRVLASYFGQWFPSTGAVLDLGAGYCEFINNATARVKYAMDLNPDVRRIGRRRASRFCSRTAQTRGRSRKGRWTGSSPATFWSICPTRPPSARYCQTRTGA